MNAPASPAGLPPPDQARVVGAYAQAAIDCAAAAGLDRARLGLPAAAPDSMPAADYVALLERAALLTGDDCFGLHVGEHMRLSTFSSYGHVLLSCATFGAAVAQTVRFESLAHDLGRTELVVEGDVGIYRWRSPWLDRPGARHLAESVMAGIMSFVNWLAHRRLPVIELAFCHAAPGALTEYERIFAAPVRFGATLTEARFPAAVLAAPIPHADTSLFPLLERHAAQLLVTRERESHEPRLLRQVRDRIVRLLAQDRANLAEVAAGLALPARTLQRRLSQAGTSYQQLLAGTRRDLADQYLLDASLSLTEIAFLLGFHEQSSFTHSFRDWHGCSPQQWRERQRRAAA